MRQHTDLKLDELRKDISLMNEQRVTGTIMGSTNENKFLRIRLNEGVITHFSYGREHGLAATKNFSLAESVRYSFSDDIEMSFPEKSKIQHSDLIKLFEPLNLQTSQSPSKSNKQGKKKTVVTVADDQ